MAITTTNIVATMTSIAMAARYRLFRRRDTQVVSATIIDGRRRLSPRSVSLLDDVVGCGALMHSDDGLRFPLSVEDGLLALT